MVSILCTLLLTAPRVDSRFDQVAPQRSGFVRTEGQTRAVVLLHGFTIQLRAESVPIASYRDWQRAGSLLVKRLAEEGDVFVFAYGQNAPLHAIVANSGLAERLAGLRKLGYREIVLVGHSAGGLIARQFVEDHPDAGVTKVIQVCSPNGGCPSAKAKVHAVQQPFLDCLTIEARQAAIKDRTEKRIPARVEFVCLVGTTDGKSDSDGLVPCDCQWTPDLWTQGIPVVPLDVRHPQAMRSAKGADALARLIRDRQPRWDAGQVEKARKQLFPESNTARGQR